MPVTNIIQTMYNVKWRCASHVALSQDDKQISHGWLCIPTECKQIPNRPALPGPVD